MKKFGWTLVGMLVGTVAIAAVAARPDSKPHEDMTQRAARLAKSFEGTAFSVSAAVQAAEKSTGGKAIASEAEVEDGKAIVDVIILLAGDVPELIEVEVDGATNKINEVERGGDDDDDHDGDDGDDDDHGDDDD